MPRAHGQPQPTVTLTGGFARTVQLDSEHSADIGRTTPLWDSWQADDHRTGSVTYGPFRTQSSLELWINGSPNSPFEPVSLEDIGNHRRLRLGVRADPSGPWSRYRWALPADWIHRDVRLIAEDRSAEPNHWVGVSAPLPPVAGWLSAFRLAGLQLVTALLLLLPGFAGLSRWRPSSASAALAFVLVGSALVSYLIFFVYLAAPRAGLFASWTILGASAVMVLLGRRRLTACVTDPEFVLPLMLSGLAAAWYSVLAYGYGGIENPTGTAFTRFFSDQPPDPLLPYWFAQRLAEHQPLRPFVGDWLTSDRPPLQAGMNLLLWPVLAGEFGYELLGAAAQSWVWIGCWIFLRSVGLARATVAWVIAPALLSGFFFVNTVYCWPKLLPTGFMLAAAGLVFRRPANERLGRSEALLAAACLALALLGHGGSYFAAAGLALAAVRFRPKLGRANLAWGLAVLAAFLAPWQAYQRWVDPPGDRLLTYHFAAHPAPDPRPAWTVIREAYAPLSWGQIAANKLSNVEYLFFGWKDWTSSGLRCLSQTWHGQAAQAYTEFTAATRFGEHLFYGLVLGPLGLALAGWLWPAPARLRAAGSLTAWLALGTTLAWCLLLFSWGSTAVPNSSYFLGATLFILGGLGLANCPRWLRWTILSLQGAWLVAIWVVDSQRPSPIGALLPVFLPGYAAAALLLAGALSGVLLIAAADRGRATKRLERSATQSSHPLDRSIA